MVDRILERGPERAVAEASFEVGSYGVSGGLVLEPALLECLAQVVAALGGEGEVKPGLGMLVGVSDFEFLRPVQAGQLTRLELRVERRLNPFLIVEARALQEGLLCAQGMLNFAFSDDAAPASEP